MSPVLHSPKGKIPDKAIAIFNPILFKATVFPPALGPEIRCPRLSEVNSIVSGIGFTLFEIVIMDDTHYTIQFRAQI